MANSIAHVFRIFVNYITTKVYGSKIRENENE